MTGHAATPAHIPLMQTDRVRLCPDHATLDHIGRANTVRGRIVRFVFWVLQLWRP